MALNKRFPRPHPLRSATAPISSDAFQSTQPILTAGMIDVLWQTAIDWPEPRTQEILTGPANYQTWHNDLKLVAQCYGLWYWIEHESPAPAGLEAKTTIQCKWLRNRAHTLFRNSITPALYAQFRFSGLSPHAFYDEIAATVGLSRPIDPWAAAYTLFTLAPRDGQSGLEAVNEFAKHWKMLEGEGVVMPNAFLIQHVLHLIDGPKWRVWRARLTQRWQHFSKPEDYPSADKLIEEIKREAAGNIDYW